MKKLIVLVCVLGSVSSQSLFGMNRALALGTSTRGMRPTAHRVLQQRDHATKKSEKTRENSDGDINIGGMNVVGNNNKIGNTYNGDVVHGDIVGGDLTKVTINGKTFSGDSNEKNHDDRAGGRIIYGDVAGGRVNTTVINGNVAGGHIINRNAADKKDVIYAGPFSSVNTGFSFSPLTPVVYVVRLLGRGMWFAGKKTKDFVFPNKGVQHTPNITSTGGDVYKDNIISHEMHGASNNLITKQMNLTGGVESIDFSTVGKLKITQCPKPCTNRAACTNCQEILTLTAPENIMPHLVQNLSNKDLTLGVKNNTNFNISGPIEYHAEVKEGIKAIVAAGAVVIHSNSIQTSELQLTMSGATEFIAPIQVSTLKVDISGSSEATVSGTATKQEIDASGAAKYNAKKLSSDSATVDTSGAASTTLGTINNKLVYDASGASKIHFSGNPKLSGETSGAAKVRKS